MTSRQWLCIGLSAILGCAFGVAAITVTGYILVHGDAPFGAGEQHP